jgi:hypothetical protein
MAKSIKSDNSGMVKKSDKRKVRTIQSPARRGKISRSRIKKAVREVIEERSRR